MVECLGYGKTLATLVGGESHGGGDTEGSVCATLDDDAIVDECLLCRPDSLTGLAELRQCFRRQTRNGDEAEESSGALVDGASHP